MSQACPTEDSNGKSVTSDDSNGKSVTSPSTEAQKQQRYRERLREIEALKAEVDSLRSDKEAFKTAVTEFTKLNEGLQAQKVELDQHRPALEVGLQVMSDPALHRLVSIYLKSETQRERLKKFVTQYAA